MRFCLLALVNVGSAPRGVPKIRLLFATGNRRHSHVMPEFYSKCIQNVSSPANSRHVQQGILNKWVSSYTRPVYSSYPKTGSEISYKPSGALAKGKGRIRPTKGSIDYQCYEYTLSEHQKVLTSSDRFLSNR